LSPAARGVIVFSHANSFSAGVYRLLFDAWREAGFAVHAVDRFGHDPRLPVTSNWPHLRDELLEFIAAHTSQPASLVGHSLGGMLSLLAASRRPDVARGVVLIDSPVVAGWRAHGLHVAKLTGLARRITPAKVASARRHVWPTREAVHEHFARKAAFARWDPRVLHDYVASGFERRGEQWHLRFERDVEARIYATLPHQLGTLLHRQRLPCPVAYIGGEQSLEARQAGLAATQRVVGERFELLPGTHLLPMEHPEATAAAVLRAIASM
jgi:pimeloyl-ACP methyl ester carboxylesterase